jgi:hypothetical protein
MDQEYLQSRADCDHNAVFVTPGGNLEQCF